MDLVKVFFRRFLFLSFLATSLTSARDAPATVDICKRFPSSSLCTGQGGSAPQPSAQNPSPAAAPAAPAAGPSPANPAVPPASPPQPPVDKATYCQQYLTHYQYFCLGSGVGNPSAANFCPSYKADCGVDQLPLLPATQTLQPDPCYQYRNQFVIVCIQRPPATDQAAKFCHNYNELCFSNKAAPPPQPQPQPQPQLPLQPQPSPPQLPTPQLPAAPQIPSPSVPQLPTPEAPASAPLNIGSGTQVGGFAGVGQNTAVNPFSGVSSGSNINAAGLPISSGSNVNFGGLIPGGSQLGSIFGGRRRRRQAISDWYIVYLTSKLVH